MGKFTQLLNKDRLTMPFVKGKKFISHSNPFKRNEPFLVINTTPCAAYQSHPDVAPDTCRKCRADGNDFVLYYAYIEEGPEIRERYFHETFKAREYLKEVN